MSQTQEYAPVVLFAYARLEHLQKTIESLRRNAEASQTALYIYCDGPKHEDHVGAVANVRRYLDGLSGFASIERFYRDRNYGLANSIIDGVTQTISKHDAVIVMEDDLVVSPFFLKYMNEGLRMYRDSERVASIHGYSYPVNESLPETFFLRGADCWGWATWARAWTRFNPNGTELLEALLRKNLTGEFDFDGAYPYTRMLKDQIRGINNSWAIRWHASCFLENMLTLYPGRSLVNNIGNDDSGTHCSATDVFNQVVATSPVHLKNIPIEASEMATKSFARYHRRQRSLPGRLAQRIRSLWK